mgnify:CR=1 FL=1
MTTLVPAANVFDSLSSFFDSPIWKFISWMLIAFLVLMWLALVVWVYKDARRRNNSPGYPRLMPYNASGEWVNSPALADLDGDGWLEIIYTPNSTGLSAKLVVLSTKTSDGTSGKSPSPNVASFFCPE